MAARERKDRKERLFEFFAFFRGYNFFDSLQTVFSDYSLANDSFDCLLNLVRPHERIHHRPSAHEGAVSQVSSVAAAVGAWILVFVFRVSGLLAFTGTFLGVGRSRSVRFRAGARTADLLCADLSDLVRTAFARQVCRLSELVESGSKRAGCGDGMGLMCKTQTAAYLAHSMKKLAIAMFLMVATLPSLAGISSGWSSGPLVVVAMPEPRTVGVSLVIPADFVSVPVRIVSGQKNSALAYEETRQAIDLISKKAKEGGQFRTSMGVVSLSQHKGGFGISSGSWSQPAASAEIYLLVPLSKERDNIFGAGVEAARFVEAIAMPGKARCELGSLQLAVENPEQYRAKVLGLISEEIKRTREGLGTSGSVKVEGLEGSVMVRQADDRNVELFLNYSLAITMEK